MTKVRRIRWQMLTVRGRVQRHRILYEHYSAWRSWKAKAGPQYLEMGVAKGPQCTKMQASGSVTRQIGKAGEVSFNLIYCTSRPASLSPAHEGKYNHARYQPCPPLSLQPSKVIRRNYRRGQTRIFHPAPVDPQLSRGLSSTFFQPPKVNAI
jgi:hypothetical protein